MTDWTTAILATAPAPVLTVVVIGLVVLFVVVVWPDRRDRRRAELNTVVDALGHIWTKHVRVRHPDHGFGTLIEPDDMRPGMLIVRWDSGSWSAVPETDVIVAYTPDDDERMWQELREALDAMDAAARIAAAAPPLHDLIPSWCDEMSTCTAHHVESCTDRPCCSTCPTREDTR